MGKAILTHTSSRKWRSVCKRWTVHLSTSCILAMTKMAQTHYPNEVGTSLVGHYTDDGFEAFVLELAPLSADSKGTRTSFYRGVDGLRTFFAKLRCASKGNGIMSANGIAILMQFQVPVRRMTCINSRLRRIQKQTAQSASWLSSAVPFPTLTQ